MLTYAVRRCGLALLIACFAMLLLLAAMHMVPGDPASIALGPLATPEMRADFRARMGLDQPFLVQYARFLGNVVVGDLGVDVWSKRPVTTMIAEQLPHTLALALVGLGWAMALGIPMGCISAVRRNGLFDKLTGVLSVACIAIPSFIVALYALLLFAVTWKWFPAIGAGADGDLADQASRLVLPSLAVGLGWVGYLARFVRASMLEVLGENHIRMARAFGLSPRRITYLYALKLAILPTVALLGVGIGHLLSGAVFAEIIFARPGVGKMVVDAVAMRNYPIVMGGVLVTTLLFAFATLVADLIAAALDPRVRQGL